MAEVPARGLAPTSAGQRGLKQPHIFWAQALPTAATAIARNVARHPPAEVDPRLVPARSTTLAWPCSKSLREIGRDEGKHCTFDMRCTDVPGKAQKNLDVEDSALPKFPETSTFPLSEAITRRMQAICASKRCPCRLGAADGASEGVLPFGVPKANMPGKQMLS